MEAAAGLVFASHLPTRASRVVAEEVEDSLSQPLQGIIQGTASMDQDTVFHGVRECIVKALDVPAESIRMDSRIMEDLGADSLDLLDLTFQLERRFGVSISPRDIERRAGAVLGGAPLEVDGVYTPEGIAALRAAMPEIPPEELPDGLTTADLPRRVRVATMVSLVARLLEQHNG